MLPWIAGMTFDSIVCGCNYNLVFYSENELDSDGVACRHPVKFGEATSSRLHEERPGMKQEKLCHSLVAVDSRYNF